MQLKTTAHGHIHSLAVLMSMSFLSEKDVSLKRLCYRYYQDLLTSLVMITRNIFFLTSVFMRCLRANSNSLVFSTAADDVISNSLPPLFNDEPVIHQRPTFKNVPSLIHCTIFPTSGIAPYTVQPCCSYALFCQTHRQVLPQT